MHLANTLTNKNKLIQNGNTRGCWGIYVINLPGQTVGS